MTIKKTGMDLEMLVIQRIRRSLAMLDGEAQTRVLGFVVDHHGVGDLAVQQKAVTTAKQPELPLTGATRVA